MRIPGHEVSIVEDDGVLIVAFSDSLDTPSHWLMLQRTLHPSSQDVKLGFDSVHISSDRCEGGAYGDVEVRKLSHQELVLMLGEEVSRELGCEPRVVVEFSVDESRRSELEKALTRVTRPGTRRGT